MTVLLHKSRMVLADRLASAGLWALATIHLLVALSVLVVLATLSPAHAQEPAACGGENLLTKYEKDDPAGFAKLRAEADAIPNGKGIFWKVEKDGQPVQVDVKGPITLDEASLSRTAVLRGFGLGLFMESDVREDLAADRLVRVLEDWMKPVAPLCLYYPGRKNPSAAFKEFINLAREFTSALNADRR